MKKSFCMLISLLILMVSIVSGQNIKKISKAGNVNRFTQVQAPQVYLYRNQLNKVVTTNFLVTYETNVPSEARTAFDKAVEIWSYLIVLSKPVKIKVKFVNDPNSGMLGGTGIPSWRNNFTNVPVYDRQYPISLAKHLDNSINYSEYDIEMEFNGANSFNYSTDGVPIADHFDFITVAIHEIGHGLGLFGSFDVQQNEGYFGYNGFPVYTTNTYPTIADQFYLNGSTRLINVTSSSTLGGLLQNDNVWYDGINAKNANNNQNIKMFAPSVWEPGSSIDHLDESSFPAGNLNSLMTPTLDPAEVNHNPGPIFLGMLKDYGHTVGRIITFTAPLSNNNIVKGQNFNITWHDNISGFGDYINFKLYKITTGEPLLINSINGNNYVFSNPGTQGNSYSWNVPNILENNLYFIRAEGSNHLVDYGQTQVFTISNIPESPKFNPPGGQYNNQQWVSIYTNSPVTEIRYTINGSEPNETSIPYTSPILVDISKTLRAKSILVLPNGSKVLSSSSDASYFIGSNSLVKEFYTGNNQYGWIGKWLNYYPHENNWLQIGVTGIEYFYKYRSFSMWTGIKSQIPTGAVIQSVEFEMPIDQILTTQASLEFRYYNPQGMYNPSDKWAHMGPEGTEPVVATMPANTGTFSIQGFISKIQAIIDGGSDYFGIGIKNSDENNSDHWVSFGFPVKMKIYYRGNIEISQLDKDDQPFGQVGYWNATYWDNKNVPATVFKTGNINLKSYQGYNGNTTQKYFKWLDQSDIVNHTTISISTGVNYFTSKFIEANLSPKVKNFFTDASNLNPGTDKIWLKDPWLIDEMDGQYGLRNQGISGGTTGLPGADWYQLDSPIDFSDPAYSNYKGVFLNQGLVQGQWTPPYYSVKVDAVQDIPLYNTGVPTGNGRTHKFYFQNWYGTNVTFQNSNALETPVVFTSDGAVAQAKLKGTQLTSNPNGYNINSQRKYVKTDDGFLHLVYESMGSVWYEVSPNNGATWYIQNNGKPISITGKQPAIDYGGYYDPNLQETFSEIVITWQESYGYSSSKIKVAYFDRSSDGPIGRMNWLDTKEVATVSGSYGSANCYPVICLSYGNFKIVFKNGSSGALLSSSGWVNSYGIYSITTPVTLTGTDNYSVNPSIAVNKTGTTTVRLVWEQIQDEYSSSIKYAVLVGSQISGSTTTISTSSGSPLNFSPSISIANNAPVVSWTGARNPGDGIDKRKAITTRGTNWGSFQVAGTDINFVNNNSALGIDERTVISWSEGTTNPVTKWMRREGIYYSTPRTLSNSGYQSQLCTGTNFQTMSAMVFKDNRVPHSSDPHYFLKSTTDFSTLEEEGGGGLNKISVEDTIVTFGRRGVASINDIEFVFEIGDILVVDSIIKFIEIPDTISYSSTNELNEHTRTSNFTLTPSTNLYFSNIYYVVTKSDPDTALTNTDAVIFKAELVNASTNQVVGTFDNMTYNKNNLEKHANIDYEVDCSGITSGEYFLRLVTSVNTDAAYGLANIVSDNTTLAKKNFNKVNFTGSEIPISYELSNNFPNPFNPSTTIRYQIPQDGIVTLKIYDILGSEVATLVNEEKLAGKYEVNFNASSLASGVYIYKIQAGSFINSKKMILLK